MGGGKAPELKESLRMGSPYNGCCLEQDNFSKPVYSLVKRSHTVIVLVLIYNSTTQAHTVSVANVTRREENEQSRMQLPNLQNNKAAGCFSF